MLTLNIFHTFSNVLLLRMFLFTENLHSLWKLTLWIVIFSIKFSPSPSQTTLRKMDLTRHSRLPESVDGGRWVLEFRCKRACCFLRSFFYTAGNFVSFRSYTAVVIVSSEYIDLKSAPCSFSRLKCLYQMYKGIIHLLQVWNFPIN